ncbi:LysR family transcriptional regulator [Marinomonas ushuaiensis DSM 15871]|uniref:LysR family transcriptional regulator n=1 Tax=Marinomonas ushuaiensis DSM 15871 TaxID=1122207 RepID=X7E549_9GAMM|nr:LysR family transcriptional regulator [Marinomonas ushuaiensis]ETX11077.1 LysR family transcriptional regulator [Marinomonas ushuaiensis DSM 15871]
MKSGLRLQDTTLRYFLEVVKYGSISKASEHLNVASSAISRQINNLEDIVGTTLFERRPRGMVLSVAGEMLATYARKNALESNRVISNIAALDGLNRGHIKISCYEGFAMDFLPRCISKFRKEHDGINFNVNVSTPDDITRRVIHDNADIGITLSYSPAKNINVAYQQPSPIFAFMHPTHPLASKEAISLTQLLPYAIALPEENTTIRQLFDISCSRLNLLFEPALVSNNIATLCHFSMSEGGIHLAGEVTMRHILTTKKLVAVPIRDKGMGIRNIEIQTLSGKTLSVVVKLFLEYLIEEMQSEKLNYEL